MKKLFVLFILILIPFVSKADDSGVCGENLRWVFNRGKNTLTISGTGDMYNYTFSTNAPWYDYINSINQLIIENGATSIGNNAFYACSGLTSVTIPNSVTSIGKGAFQECSGLTSILIPNSVTSIGVQAFCDCSNLTSITISNSVTNIGNYVFAGCSALASITIPNGVTKIGNYAFAYCEGLALITIPNSVTDIGEGAFYNCSGLTSVTIPNSVTSIGESVFSDCSGLNSITVSSGNTKYDSRNNCNAIIETFSNVLIAGCMNTVIPNSVTSIGKSAFFGCNGLTSITIPNNVTYIGDYAFCNCGSLIEVVFPSKLSSIGNQSFYSCRKITNINLSTTEIVAIGEMSFSYCYNLKEISLPTTIKSIGEYAFAFSDYLNIIKIDTSNPYLCTKDNVIFDKKMSSLIMCAPAKSGEYTIPDGVKRIENTAFSGCNNLTKVILPQTTTHIGSDAFCYCRGLQDISLPNGIIEIQYGAFRECSLKKVKIPESLISIGSEAFSCETIESIESLIKEPFPIDKYTFGSTLYNKANVYVPEGCVNKYKSTEGWNLFENITEIIPNKSFTLTINVSGNGDAIYDGLSIRNTTQPFTIIEGTSVTIFFSPDNGYRIKSVKENSTDVTSYVSSGTYTISSISRDTNLEVEFEAIPPTTYTLSIKATGNGYVSYNGTTIRNETNSFSVNEGDNALLSFIPESGYRLASVRVNYSDVTNWVYDNQYTISNISSNTTVEVEFEAIPVTTYSLSIAASGNGYVSYNGNAVRNRTQSFTVDEGASATIIFTPDNGNSISSVKLNYSNITSQISGNSYTISNITANTTLTVTFQEDVNALTVDGLNYTVTSQSNRTVTLTSSGSGQVLTVPATITQNGTTWNVTDIDKDALKGNTELAAIIWNPEAAFTATVSNPNLLLYVKSSDYAPATIQNVVVNGTANNIVLTEAQSGNNFYCPQSFVAQEISYTHNYKMQTGIGEARGWETIVLPFDVQTITHATKGTIKPFANWKSGDTAKPFWLMELTGTGFVETGSIKAYTPYIISMPNNPQYDSQWLLNGKVTFAANGVNIGKTENLSQPTFNGRNFIPCLTDMDGDMAVYSLNVNNDYESNNSGMTEGSMFVWKLRHIHPFEAYMTSTSSAPQYAFGVFEGMTTGIQTMVDGRWMKEDVVYDLQGRRVQTSNLFARPHSHREKSQTSNLKKGVYIVNGKKKVIK